MEASVQSIQTIIDKKDLSSFELLTVMSALESYLSDIPGNDNVSYQS